MFRQHEIKTKLSSTCASGYIFVVLYRRTVLVKELTQTNRPVLEDKSEDWPV